ncbi:MAG: hypothetical protein AAFV95_05200 [Bacteroidota bacterium]
MKNVKQIIKWTFIFAVFGSVVVACQKDASTELETSLQTSVEMEHKQQLEPSDELQARIAIPPNTPAFLCYIAAINIDADCDGTYETGQNETTFTFGTCWDRVQEMIVAQQAIGNNCVQPDPNACVRTNCRKTRN